MAKEKNESVFEVSKIRELVELMEQHELNEVDLKQGDQRISLRRGGQPMMVPAPTMAAPAIAPSAPQNPPANAAAEAPVDDENVVYITSPAIGTFYSRPKPDAADFVKVGDVVTPDTIVCIVEAMKMFSDIPAGVSGKIVECLVKNEEPIDNNKPLFKVLKS